MNWTNRALLALIVIAVASVATKQTWAKNLGLDVWNVPALHAHTANEKRRDQVLDEDRHMALQRALRRAEMVEQVIQGRMSFATAMALNLELAQSDDAARHYLHRHFAGRTEQEKSAHQLVEHLHNATNPQGKVVSEWLACELATMMFE